MPAPGRCAAPRHRTADSLRAMHAHGAFDGARLRGQAAGKNRVVGIVGKAGRQRGRVGDLRQLRRIARQRTGHQAQPRQDHAAQKHALGGDGVDGGGGAAVGDDHGLARRQRARADGGGKAVAAQLGRIAIAIGHAGQLRQRHKILGRHRQHGAQARGDGAARHVRQQRLAERQRRPLRGQAIELRMRHGAAGQPVTEAGIGRHQRPFDARIARVDQQ